MPPSPPTWAREEAEWPYCKAPPAAAAAAAAARGTATTAANHSSSPGKPLGETAARRLNLAPAAPSSPLAAKRGRPAPPPPPPLHELVPALPEEIPSAGRWSLDDVMMAQKRWLDVNSSSLLSPTGRGSP